MIKMEEAEARRDVQGLLQDFQGLVVSVRPEQDLSEVPVDDERKGIELAGPADLLDRLIEPADVHQVVAVPVMGQGVVRIVLDGELVFGFGGRPVPVVSSVDLGQGDPGLGQLLVDLEGPEGVLPGFRIGYVGRDRSVVGKDAVGVGQPRVRQGILGIDLDGPLEMDDGLLNVRRGPLVPEIAPLGVGVERVVARRCRCASSGAALRP